MEAVTHGRPARPMRMLPSPGTPHDRVPALVAAALIGLAPALPGAARAQPAASAAVANAPSPLEAQSLALSRAVQAVVAVHVEALDGARTATTLGAARSGSGVVIGDDDVVLTIGYLLLEAATVELETDDGRRWPARVLALDPATGLGLVQALAPLRLPAVPLGDPRRLDPREPLTVASGGAAGAVTPARLAQRRDFSGHWEYHVEGALFTTPPRRDHAGAALFDPRGALLGVGSLFVAEVAVGAERGPAAAGSSGAGATAARGPGNLFVPVDLLVPVLAELRAQGRSAAGRRPWLGLNCIDDEGVVRVVRVGEDSPADVAGVEVGDVVLAIDGVPVADLARLWKTLWAGAERGAPTERAVRLELQRGTQRLQLTVQAVEREKTLRRPMPDA